MLLDTLKKLSVWMLTCQVTLLDTEIFVCLNNAQKMLYLCVYLHRDPNCILTLANISKISEYHVLDAKYQTKWNLKTNDARPFSE